MVECWLTEQEVQMLDSMPKDFHDDVGRRMTSKIVWCVKQEDQANSERRLHELDGLGTRGTYEMK